MIECRRTQGNIFKYHEFFEEFEKQYKNVIEHLNKGPNTPPNETANNGKEKNHKLSLEINTASMKCP